MANKIFHRRDMPFVMMNGAVSADGKLALENRSVIQFSSARDQRFVLQLRATADAVLCGADTVETFSIDLGADSEACRKKRLRKGLPEEPMRVLVSDDGNIDPKARIFRKRVSPVIVLTTDRAFKRCSSRLRGVATVKSFGKSTVSFAPAFRWLRHEFGVKRLLCEGGGETNAALIKVGVVDELHITICPLVLRGGRAATFCDGEGRQIHQRCNPAKVESGEGNPERVVSDLHRVLNDPAGQLGDSIVFFRHPL